MTKGFERLAVLVATAGGVGNFPRSPGTAGSLPGIALGYLLHLLAGGQGSALVTIALLVLTPLTALAWWAIHVTEEVWNVHDDGRIVIDEVLGQAIAVCFVPPEPLPLFAAFVLFRLFDIAKPFPVGWIDRKGPGAVGTLFDDLVAGVMAGGAYRLLINWSTFLGM